MSRSIDYDALTPDDAAHLQQRPWLIAEAIRQGRTDFRETVEALTSAPDAPESEEADDEEFVDLRDMTVDELRSELSARNLETSGKKADLVERLSVALGDEEEEEDDEVEEG